MMIIGRVFVVFVVLMVGIIQLVSGHSMMRCAKWDSSTGTCSAGVRNEGYAFITESYLWNPGMPTCQFPWQNPISSYYSNGASCPDWAPCPTKMGTFTPNEQFTVMWWARNHAVDDQQPATVFLYLSPLETADQGSDVSVADIQKNLLCQAPYKSCGGQNGNEVPCTMTCTFPNVAKGIYTLYWKWVWQGVTYTTCADINVVAGGGDPPTSSGSSSTTSKLTTASKAPATTGSKTPATTGSKTPATTGSKTPATTGKKNAASTTGSKSLTTGNAAPSTTGAQSSGGSDTCVLGQEQCVTSTTFKSCYRATATTLQWSPERSCQAGLVCKPWLDNNHIICDWP